MGWIRSHSVWKTDCLKKFQHISYPFDIHYVIVDLTFIIKIMILFFQFRVWGTMSLELWLLYDFFPKWGKSAGGSRTFWIISKSCPMYITANVYRQTTDKLMFKGVIFTVRWIRKLDIVKCAINKQNILIFNQSFVFYPNNVLCKVKSHINVKITVVCL